ncbi:hypothetical protein B5M09_005787 [Aphanomyces astaci]|uniref:Uncharacterized protein n=1 Tax=Aphanomyces astaci TaxID=112090 RepID=A0A3R7XRW9_APHAT|nr:hypothetical protein B5M09_005787 [Aphanomyces astaci]
MFRTVYSPHGVIFGCLFLEITMFMRGKPGKGWTDAYAIIKAGHFQLLSLQAVPISAATMTSAACEGRLDLVRWIVHVTNADIVTVEALDAAASNGHLQVLEFTQEKCSGIFYARRAMTSSAVAGHLKVVKYLFATSTCLDVVTAIGKAATAEQYHVAMWLEQQIAGKSTGKASGDDTITTKAKWSMLDVQLQELTDQLGTAKREAATANLTFTKQLADHELVIEDLKSDVRRYETYIESLANDKAAAENKDSDAKLTLLKANAKLNSELSAAHDRIAESYESQLESLLANQLHHTNQIPPEDVAAPFGSHHTSTLSSHDSLIPPLLAALNQSPHTVEIQLDATTALFHLLKESRKYTPYMHVYIKGKFDTCHVYSVPFRSLIDETLHAVEMSDEVAASPGLKGEVQGMIVTWQDHVGGGERGSASESEWPVLPSVHRHSLRRIDSLAQTTASRLIQLSQSLPEL